MCILELDYNIIISVIGARALGLRVGFNGIVEAAAGRLDNYIKPHP